MYLDLLLFTKFKKLIVNSTNKDPHKYTADELSQKTLWEIPGVKNQIKLNTSK